jgi:serine phosphatase RsbU (regulator of sigma subunit)
MSKRILERVKEFQGDARQDDATLLALQRNS